MFLLSILLAAAMAPPPPTPAMDTFGPNWLRAPSSEDVRRYHPDGAARAGIEGRVVLDCEIGRLGEMASCQIVSESPAGMRFGESALKLSKFYKVRLRGGPDPTQAGSRLRVPIHFPAPEGALR
jgi:periplasmic protein TonB